MLFGEEGGILGQWRGASLLGVRHEAMALGSQLATVEVRRNVASDPEEPAIEARPVRVEAAYPADGPGHGLVHGVFDLIDPDPTDQVGAQPGVDAAVNKLPRVLVAGSCRVDGAPLRPRDRSPPTNQYFAFGGLQLQVFPAYLRPMGCS